MVVPLLDQHLAGGRVDHVAAGMQPLETGGRLGVDGRSISSTS